MAERDQELRDEALAELAAARPGAPSGPGVRALVEHLAPVIQVRVTRTVMAYGRGRALGDLRATVEEMVQLVFAKLFEGEARLLAMWEPNGGLSLRNWVGRIARLRTEDILRSGKRDPYRHEAAPPEHMERLTGSALLGDEIETIQLWERVRDCVREGQSELGTRLFGLIIEEDRTTKELEAETGLSAAAIFQWRRRLRKAIKACMEQHS